MILTSPKGKAEWPHLVDPDIEFNPDGLYHTKLVCKKSESLEVKKAIDDLIAQEVKEALDVEGVDTFAGWDTRNDGIQVISREMFISPLINAIKELKARIEVLENE